MYFYVLDRRCVYWDVKTNAWSSDKCTVVSENADEVICQFDHLTKFKRARAEIQKIFSLIFGSNENFKICFRDQLAFSNDTAGKYNGARTA